MTKNVFQMGKQLIKYVAKKEKEMNARKIISRHQ